MKYPNFVSGSYPTRNSQWDNTQTLNLYLDVNEAQTGKDENIVEFVPTPGLTLALANQSPLASSPIRGLYTATNGYCFVVCSNKLYRIFGNYPFTRTEIGTLHSTRGIVTFADSGSLLVLVDGNNGYSYDMIGSVGFNRIVDTNFLGANFVAYYDTYFVFNKPSTNIFYWSNPNSVVFDPLNFDTKSGNGDPISGLTVFDRNLWLEGVQHTEVWYNTGGTDQFGAPITFQRIPGAYNESGTVQPHTAAVTEFGMFIVCQNSRGGAYVAITNGFNYSRISTTAVELELQKYTGQMTAFVYQQQGHIFYQINPFNSPTSWVYDYTVSHQLGKSEWHERAYTDPKTSQLTRHRADNHCYFNGYHLVGDYRTGLVYWLDLENFTDNGDRITKRRRAPHLASEQNRITYSKFRLDCKVGVATREPFVTIPPSGPITLTGDTTFDVPSYMVAVDTEVGQIGYVIGEFGTLQGDAFNNLLTPPGQNLVCEVFTYDNNTNNLIFSVEGQFTYPDQSLFQTLQFIDNADELRSFSSDDATTQTYGSTGVTWTWSLGGNPFYNSQTVQFNLDAAPVDGGASGQNRLAWTPATPGTFPIGGYRVFNADTNELIADVGLSQDYNDSQAPGVYNYYVKAYDTHDNLTTNSNTWSGTILTWYTQQAANAHKWTNVVWSPELSLAVAVAAGASGNNKCAMISNDGINWVEQTLNAANWFALDWSQSNGLFCALSTSNTSGGKRVATSPDGITWTERTAAENNAWFGLVWSTDLQIFVAVANSGTHRVMTSPDGTTWTARTCPTSGWLAVAWSSELGLFAAVGNANAVMTSPDGITWTARTGPSGHSSNNWEDICYSNAYQRFVAVSTGGNCDAMYSDDGITWTATTATQEINWNSVCWSGDLQRFQAVAQSGEAGQTSMASADGITWENNDIGSIQGCFWDRVCWTRQLGLFIAVAQTSNGSSRQLVSVSAVGDL